ncbi:MAG TPA: pilus assembly protein N-terminal domain-containing protein [Dongiaceae bacterium]|nr:pilus assembly protein N-terminal domain-containing protein [Dongiaceae bacterium]
MAFTLLLSVTQSAIAQQAPQAQPAATGAASDQQPVAPVAVPTSPVVAQPLVQPAPIGKTPAKLEGAPQLELVAQQSAPTPASVPAAAVAATQVSQTAPLANSPAISTPPTALPAAPKTIQIPVPVLPAAPSTSTSNMVLPLNKTQGIELDRDIRDVIIGNPDIADIVIRSQKQIFLIGKRTGDTNIFFTDADGNLVRKIDLVVQPDVDGIQSNIEEILPGEHIGVRGMGDSVVLSGTASSDGAAAKARDIARHFVGGDNNVISMIRISNEQQVLLRVRVAEAKKTVLKELGVDNLLSPQTLGPLTIQAATSALGLGTDIAGAIGISSGGSSSTIRLLEQQGYIRTLAEPNLLAVSGEVASMLAGGEYPIPIAQQNGTISVDYKPFGVILSFLPVVLDSGRISLRISTEVSALSDQNTVSAAGFTFKSFVTRRANSVVELPSGGELMIAGLLQNDITGGLNGVPGLMNLPILGSLFRSTSFQRNETELVVLVTAVLAKPADPRQFVLPTDGFVPGSDVDRYFLGHLQDMYLKKPATGPNAPQTLQGPLGYIVQ